MGRIGALRHTDIRTSIVVCSPRSARLSASAVDENPGSENEQVDVHESHAAGEAGHGIGNAFLAAAADLLLLAMLQERADVPVHTLAMELI